MEIRQFAERVLLSDSLEQKLLRLDENITDNQPGTPLQLEVPGRPPNLEFAPPRTAPAMPRGPAFVDPQKRAIAHHIMANHELQACEVMAYVLCAFPTAPTEFRFGMVRIIDDEQRHTRMHMERAHALGVEFGTLPVNGYFWTKALDFKSILDYLAGLPLTFEGRNLDHTLEFEEYFQQAGDEKGAAVMRTIHHDEITHVAFGIDWLRRLKPANQTDWETYQSHLHWPLRPEKSKGNPFHREPRRQAGLSEEFIDQLEQEGNG